MDNELEFAVSECRRAIHYLQKLLARRGIVPSVELKLRDLPPILDARMTPPRTPHDIIKLMEDMDERSKQHREVLERWADEQQLSIVARELYILTSALDRIVMLAADREESPNQEGSSD